MTSGSFCVLLGTLLREKTHIKTTSEQYLVKRDIIHVSILLIVALCVGIYLIGTTVVISKDGITFIEYAKNFEISPTKTMIQQDQHPGYPVMILGVHKIARFLSESQSVFSWIYCAQGIALVFRILAIIVLYFLGKELVGARSGFLALLILVLLPKPAHYGSDALSDWAHLFFLAGGILLLVHGAIDKRWWLFGFAGLAAGMGYLVRPECAQVVVYGCLWSTVQLIWPRTSMARRRVAIGMVLLIGGFLVTAGSYMMLKGAVFPKKHIGEFALYTQSAKTRQVQQQYIPTVVHTADILPSDLAQAFGKLFENIGETLMWFFVPALLIGLYKHFQKQDWCEPKRFFVIAIIALNIPLMVWLYCRSGYMSARHSLPLVVFTIFYIPIGLRMLANWLEEKFRKETQQTSKKHGSVHFFVILMVIGIVIYTPKLLRPLHYDKLIFRKVAEWLAKNTQEDAIIAVPDPRISFYSERSGIVCDGQEVPDEAKYIVKVFESRKGLEISKEFPGTGRLFSAEGGRYKINVYENFQP